MKNIRDLINTLDIIANEVEEQNRSIALSIDLVSDQIEKKAFFNQSTWLPGRTTRTYLNKDQSTPNRNEKRAVYVCLSCNLRRTLVTYKCPRCGHTMQITFC